MYEINPWEKHTNKFLTSLEIINLFYNYLPINQAAIAIKLANRKGELNPSDATAVGDQRGDPKQNDSYFTIQLKFGMTLGRQRR